MISQQLPLKRKLLPGYDPAFKHSLNAGMQGEPGIENSPVDCFPGERLAQGMARLDSAPGMVAGRDCASNLPWSRNQPALPSLCGRSASCDSPPDCRSRLTPLRSPIRRRSSMKNIFEFITDFSLFNKLEFSGNY
jgi:hypothetical protein